MKRITCNGHHLWIYIRNNPSHVSKTKCKETKPIMWPLSSQSLTLNLKELEQWVTYLTIQSTDEYSLLVIIIFCYCCYSRPLLISVICFFWFGLGGLKDHGHPAPGHVEVGLGQEKFTASLKYTQGPERLWTSPPARVTSLCLLVAVWKRNVHRNGKPVTGPE